MVASQERIKQLLPNFKYMLGFCGYYFMSGNEAEQAGDVEIVEQASRFTWFNHYWRHDQVHTMTAKRLNDSYTENIRFAQEHNLPMTCDYMIPPHHSGVHPIIESFYNQLNERGVLCTSTIFYPKQQPNWGGRGFIYRGVMVLPRQTCNLYTTVNRFQEYKGGKAALDASIKGDYLFKLFLFTPVMIFMTHMSNYANDQLAEYMFENVIEFVSKWTNLHILTPPPVEIARRYFNMYPQEVTPLWTNPCDNEFLTRILPTHFSCDRFPKFIIVGPQKTGSTALQKFLEAHPLLVSTRLDPQHFEEVQFFSDRNYLYGLDWYQKHFPEPTSKDILLFEKSATYFDSEITPRRISSLLPGVKVVVILSDPVRRAYSWYQHMKYHQDPVAMNHTFHKIISAYDTAPRFLRDSRQRYLKPGAYAIHLARWLQFFDSSQIYLMDGDKFNQNPIPELNQLQNFLNVAHFVDFGTKLRFDPAKGFFCRIDMGCLGNKKYPPMDPESRLYLQKYYSEHNANLRIILDHIQCEHPAWLREISVP